jgi:SAM-dependent methyltransferase
MPSSQPRQLNEIVELIMLTRPGTLLDVGIGYGKYGFLAREYLEYWDGRATFGERRHRIDGIEAFATYVTPLQRQIYDEIFIGEATTVLPRISRRYDLVLLIDVLEHLDRQEGDRLLDQCLTVGRNLIVSTPAKMEEQGALFENTHERHRHQWAKADFTRFTPKFFAANPYSIICYLGDQASAVGREFHRLDRRAAVLRRAPWLRALKRLVNRLR